MNHKRTERLYREEGLALRRKRRRKGASSVRVKPSMPQRPNEKWAMDFVHDSTADGRRFRALVVRIQPGVSGNRGGPVARRQASGECP